MDINFTGFCFTGRDESRALRTWIHKSIEGHDYIARSMHADQADETGIDARESCSLLLAALS